MLLKNAKVVNDQFDVVDAEVQIQGEKIEKIVPQGTVQDDQVYDLAGCTIIPGFIDQHIHGCAGYDTGDATPEAIEGMSAHLAKHGVTSFCPTTMTLPGDQLSKILKNVKHCMDHGVSGAYPQGVNMEGPYIAMSKKGAQNAAYVRNPDPEEFKGLFDECGGIIKLVDIAAETDGADEFIRQVCPLCQISLAHTAANYEQAKHGFDLGISQVTHMFNAMSGLTHRAPGVVGAVMDDDKVRAELICDGFHISPVVLRIAFKTLGEDRTIVVSDSLKAADCPDGEYELGGQPVFVRNGKALLEDGTIAASTSNIHEEFKNLLSFGIPFRQAVKSATINPARQLKVDHMTGSIKEGKLADIVVLDQNYDIKMVIITGKVVVG
jgi:N-acetylglucosamine-6-phosphate deacetylase